MGSIGAIVLFTLASLLRLALDMPGELMLLGVID